MERIVLFICAFFVCTLTNAQPYTHPTVGIQNEYVGACLVSNCGPFNYFDNGGAGANYSSGIQGIYRVFCPSIAGRCMQVTFNSFSTEAGFDYLQVKNGPTQNSPQFLGAPNTPTINAGEVGLSGFIGTPFTFTSTDPSGCLTFRYASDFTVTDLGWSASMTCVPCVGGPSATSNSDCLFSTALCSNASVTSMANGPGIVSEGCTGTQCPAGGENHSNWYRFVAQNSGTLTITITPAVAADDYDFAIYGPNVSCGALGNPIRCSDSGASGVTAANQTTVGNNVENVYGSGYLSQLNVVAGQSYYLVVDKWSPSGGTGYTLSFGGTASLNCLILPVQLSSFEVDYEPTLNVVDVSWITQTEINMSHYDIERSTDGENFKVINRVNATNAINQESQYFALDQEPFAGVNYYRLNQFDFDGTSKYSEIRAVNVLDPTYDVLTVFPNPTTLFTEVIFNAYSRETAELNLYNARGELVSSEQIEVAKGGNRLDLNLSEQSKGIYILTIVTKHKTHRTKVVKE